MDVGRPTRSTGQPLDRPFAWALIKLDGADTALLHAVDVDDPGKISTGDRVHAHWVDEPVGSITDIAYFALGDADGAGGRAPVTTNATR